MNGNLKTRNFCERKFSHCHDCAYHEWVLRFIVQINSVYNGGDGPDSALVCVDSMGQWQWCVCSEQIQKVRLCCVIIDFEVFTFLNAICESTM